MVRFIRQGEKRRGERRTFRTKEQLCGEQRLARGTAEQWYGGVRWRGERRNYRAKE